MRISRQPLAEALGDAMKGSSALSLERLQLKRIFLPACQAFAPLFVPHTTYYCPYRNMDLSTFYGRRLMLRAIEPEDLALLYRWENDPAMSSSNDLAAPVSKHRLRHFIRQSQLELQAANGSFLHLIICDRATAREVGSASLYNINRLHSRCSVGLLIDPACRRRGYAREALQLLLNYVFTTLQLEHVYAEVAEPNTVAEQFFTAAGFSLQAVLPHWLRHRDGFCAMKILARSNPHNPPVSSLQN